MCVLKIDSTHSFLPFQCGYLKWPTRPMFPFHWTVLESPWLEGSLGQLQVVGTCCV